MRPERQYPTQAPLARDRRRRLALIESDLIPGLWLGVVHAPAGFIGRMREQRLVFDRHGDPVQERAMAELSTPTEP